MSGGLGSHLVLDAMLSFELEEIGMSNGRKN
jgi:hypothetical protein